jgi:hypothetical protein
MPRRKPKATEALGVFEANLQRARAFLRIFDTDRERGRPTADENELLRGSLVFAVGAFDAYLSDLILEVVPKCGPKSRELTVALKAIAKSDPSLSLRVALAPSAADRREEFSGALGEWLSTRSFHGPDKVVEALGYVACPITWEEFDAASGVSAAEELRKITKYRHEIVHEGKKPRVTRWPIAEDANNLVRSLARHIDVKVCVTYGAP